MINERDILTETLPEGLINLGDDNHIANMANFSMYVNAKQSVSGDPGSPKIDLPQDALDRFGNWTGQTDTKIMAQDLKKRGLIGAQQLIDDQPNVNSASSIRNSQSDWKVNAIQNILANAKKLNIRTKAEVMANKDVLLDKPEWRDAVNNDSFKNVHPNFWNIISDSILPEQYKKFDTQNNLTAKK